MNNVLSRLSKVYQLSKKNNGIIRVYDFDLDSCSYTMERADSKLENFVKASSLSDESKINIIRQIVHTISLVHQRGVLHRDLSPTNIFFVDNIIKLADFGLGKNLIL
jgi:serine/threonine protein kinase